ncbi:MAG TPA: Tab2/Atab2 family RNA-binding protein [Crinalium sp.]|jgi:hypothetical protein
MPVIWELDFYSRPVVDEQNKKLWEVLVCESPLDIAASVDSLFRYSKFYANTEVNSGSLRKALEEAIAQSSSRPDKIRFFRRQMANMITKGCEDLGIAAYPSRRTLALNQWINQRMEEVYPSLPNYQSGSNPSVSLPPTTPQPLPDALRGQQWAFVSLEASAFADMPDWKIDFEEAFPIAMAGVAPDTKIPGIIIYSSRALPLAGWMSGLELAFVKTSEDKPARLLLETGASESWILANLTTPPLQQEARNFEALKQKANQVHFLAVQSDPNSEAFTGFWLMQELNLA